MLFSNEEYNKEIHPRYQVEILNIVSSHKPKKSNDVSTWYLSVSNDLLRCLGSFFYYMQSYICLKYIFAPQAIGFCLFVLAFS